MSSFPIRKKNSLIAEMLLLKSAKKFFLIVEDENLNIIYHNMIDKLYNGKVQTKIYSMKSKKGVMDFFEKWKPSENVIPDILFLVDRDFDFLKGLVPPTHKNYLELDYYTIENYLLSKQAIIRLMQSKDTSETNILEQKLDWDNWIKYQNEAFEMLFICYAIAYKYDLYQNCSISPHKYLLRGSSQVNEDKVIEYKEEVKRLLETVMNLSFQSEYNEVRGKFICNEEINYNQLIKGKYLLTATLKYIHTITGKKFDEDLSITLLSNYIDKSSIYFIKTKLDKIINLE